jgi:hypothetical protein
MAPQKPAVAVNRQVMVIRAVPAAPAARLAVNGASDMPCASRSKQLQIRIVWPSPRRNSGTTRPLRRARTNGDVAGLWKAGAGGVARHASDVGTIDAVCAAENVGDFADLPGVPRLVVRDEREPVTKHDAADDRVDVAAPSERHRVGVLHRIEQGCAARGQRLRCGLDRQRPARSHPIRNIDPPLAAANARDPRIIERYWRFGLFGKRLASARRNQQRHGLFHDREMLENLCNRPLSGAGSPIPIGGSNLLDCRKQSTALGIQELEWRG